jgi:hypothetical protein
VESRTTVIIPFDDRVIFVSLLHCPQLSSWLSEVAQTLNTISGIQFLVCGQRAPKAVASSLGLSRGLPRGMTRVVGEP